MQATVSGEHFLKKGFTKFIGAGVLRGGMPFLLPSQQCQSVEVNINKLTGDSMCLCVLLLE